MIIIGIDIGKNKHEATLIDEKGNIIGKSIKFENSTAGFNKLISSINNYNISNDKFVFSMEATGHYWLALFSKLVESDYNVQVINPIQTDACRKFYIRETKNDSKDSFLIAQVTRFNGYSKTTLPDEVMISLKELTRFRTFLVDDISDYKRKATVVLDKIFPEYTQIFSDTFGKTSKEILTKYPLPKDILDEDLESLAKVLSTSSKGRLGYSKAEQLQNLAKESFGIKFATEALVMEIKSILSTIEHLQNQVSKLDEKIAVLLRSLGTTIETIPGIGPILGAIIVSEIGDINRFSHASKLVAYAGIDPTVKQSGEFNATKNRMSKRGTPYLRRALWTASIVAAFNDPNLHEYYLKKKNEGKHHGTIIGAIARKLIYRIFIVLKDNIPYQCNKCEA
nr:IS110 family transposase [uncultured Terrisporobacter sp.]